MNAHKSFEVFTTELRMTFKMHCSILKGIILCHVVLVILLVVLTFSNLPPVEQGWFKQILENHLFNFRTFNLAAAFDQITQLPAMVTLKRKLFLTLLVYFIWPALVFLFHRRTQRKFSRKTLRGSRLISESELKKCLRTRGPALALTDNLRVPTAFAARNFFISGAPGTGKTTIISRIIADLKTLGRKAIVYDAKGGEFVAKFYNPRTDLIYNPFDARSFHFNFFDILAEPRSMVTAFDTIAAAIIPDERNTQAQFFVDTARKILSAVLQFAFVKKLRSVGQVAELLSTADLHGTLMNILREVDPKLCTFILKPASGQTQGVLSVLSQHTRTLNYLAEQPNQQRLCLSKWLSNNRPGIIFLPNAADQKETLGRIFSFLIECISTTLLSLRDDPGRHISFLLDEVTTLGRMQALFELIKLGRSKGANFYLGIQEKSQLDYLYGEHMANSLINFCNNHIIFRCNDNYTAQYASNLLGEAEHENMESSYSSGYKEVRDGESYHRSNRLDKLVLPSQIQTLPDLHFYLKLYGLPVAQCNIHYRNYPDVAAAFIPNEHFLSRGLKLRSNETPGQPSVKPESKDLEQPAAKVRGEVREGDYPIDEFSF